MAQIFGSVAASDERRRVPTSITYVSEEKETSARGRLVGSACAVHRRPRLRVSLSLLVWIVVVSLLVCETLIFGTRDWLLFWGLSFAACLPQLSFRLGTGSCPNHRFSAVELSCVLATYDYKHYDVDPTELSKRRG